MSVGGGGFQSLICILSAGVKPTVRLEYEPILDIELRPDLTLARSSSGNRGLDPIVSRTRAHPYSIFDTPP